VLVLDDRDQPVSMTAAARRWLEEILTVPPVAGGRLPDIVYAVVARGRGGDREVAKARVPTVAGGWAVVHASLLEGDPQAAAVVIEPARQPELAGLVAAAYGLTAREQSVVALLLRGLATRAIARVLHLSEHTVHDYLKAIYAKVGVHSRSALAARIFFEHYATRMADGTNLDADGWFATDAPAAAQPPAPAERAP
jgi:DNA-binding CsgD family transcriptional regulator